MPVAFAFMLHEDSISLEFMYKQVTKVLDPTNVRMVIVDKDFSNIDFIGRFYRNARVYICDKIPQHKDNHLQFDKNRKGGNEINDNVFDLRRN